MLKYQLGYSRIYLFKKIEIDFKTDSYILRGGEEYTVDSYLLKK